MAAGDQPQCNIANLIEIYYCGREKSYIMESIEKFFLHEPFIA